MSENSVEIPGWSKDAPMAEDALKAPCATAADLLSPLLHKGNIQTVNTAHRQQPPDDDTDDLTAGDTLESKEKSRKVKEMDLVGRP